MQPIKLGYRKVLNNELNINKVQIINTPDSYKSAKKKISHVLDTLFSENDLSEYKVISDSKSIGGHTLNGTYVHYLPADELQEVVKQEVGLLVINLTFCPTLIKTMLTENKDNYLVSFMCTMDELKSFIFH